MTTSSAADRERFVRDFLRFHGAKLVGPLRGPFTAELPPALARRLKAREPTFVFRAADLAEHPGAVLVAPGNPIFDRMLRIARGGGAVSRRYLRPDRELDPAAVLAGIAPGGRMILGEAIYRPRVLFTFRIAYRAFDGFDEIRAIMVDVPAGALTGARAQDGRDFFRNLNLADEPDPQVATRPDIDLSALHGLALAALETRLGPQVGKFAQRADALLARENERLQEFYLALIEEEKVRLQKRGGRAAVAAVPRKLEWLKRAQREMRLFAPEVRVSLLGLEEIWVPIRLLAGSGAEGEEPLGELDLATGEVRAIVCQACGDPVAETVVCAGGHLVCGRCRRSCERCGAATCPRCAGPAVVGSPGVCYDAPSLDPSGSVHCPACAEASRPG